MLKRCPRCEQYLGRSAFNKNRAASDGLQHVCRECQRDYENTRAKRLGGWPTKKRGAGSWKLSDAQVREMRRLREQGIHLKHLADHFGVNLSTVWYWTTGERANRPMASVDNPQERFLWMMRLVLLLHHAVEKGYDAVFLDVLNQATTRMAEAEKQAKASVAQVAEHRTRNADVAGSKPAAGSTSVSIEDLPISIRAYNALKQLKVQTIDDIASYTERELLLVRNFGRRTLREVREVLARYGRTLATVEYPSGLYAPRPVVQNPSMANPRGVAIIGENKDYIRGSKEWNEYMFGKPLIRVGSK